MKGSAVTLPGTKSTHFCNQYFVSFWEFLVSWILVTEAQEKLAYTVQPPKRFSTLKVPMPWLRILHIYNIWNPVIRIAIYLVVPKFYLRGLFGCYDRNGKYDRNDVKPGICVTVNTRSYRHTENISLDFEPNRYYLMKINKKFSNPWLVWILKHYGVTRQIPRLTSLPLILTAKKSTKIKFSNDKICCNSYHRIPNIINM